MHISGPERCVLGLRRRPNPAVTSQKPQDQVSNAANNLSVPGKTVSLGVIVKQYRKTKRSPPGFQQRIQYPKIKPNPPKTGHRGVTFL